MKNSNPTEEPVIGPGSYGIESVPSDTPDALTCGHCGLSWLEDITPAGRCPWEYDHEYDDSLLFLTDH